MKISDIFKILENSSEVNKFIEKYSNEFINYGNKLNKKGASTPIRVDDDFSFIFNKKHLINICQYFLTDNLTELQINYIVDCLTLSDSVSFENEELRELLEALTDIFLSHALRSVPN